MGVRSGGLYRVFSRAVEIFFKVMAPFMGPLYRVYEEHLYSQILRGPVPRHIAIIPDGNRRWASLKGLPRHAGHEMGYRKMREVLSWIEELGVERVTIYAMSYENCLRRPKEERERLFEIVERGLRELAQEALRRGVRIVVMGRLDMVPESLRQTALEAEKASQGPGREKVVNVALCYGGRQEIVEAVRKIAWGVEEGIIDPEEIDEEMLVRHLYIGDEPDLVIRTSGEMRISNFLLWQSAYSELYFCDAYWPDFRKIDLWRAVRSYQMRERRFGS